MSIRNLLLTICLLEALALYICDRGMKKNRSEGVTDDRVRWAPLYWEDASLFTARGNAFRRAALVTMILLVLTFLALAIVTPVGA